MRIGDLRNGGRGGRKEEVRDEGGPRSGTGKSGLRSSAQLWDMMWWRHAAAPGFSSTLPISPRPSLLFLFWLFRSPFRPHTRRTIGVLEAGIQELLCPQDGAPWRTRMPRICCLALWPDVVACVLPRCCGLHHSPLHNATVSVRLFLSYLARSHSSASNGARFTSHHTLASPLAAALPLRRVPAI